VTDASCAGNCSGRSFRPVLHLECGGSTPLLSHFSVPVLTYLLTYVISYDNIICENQPKFANSFPCHTSEKSLCKSFLCHTSKNTGFKVPCLPHIQKMAGVPPSGPDQFRFLPAATFALFTLALACALCDNLGIDSCKTGADGARQGHITTCPARAHNNVPGKGTQQRAWEGHLRK
jgi:hypothetical protein